MGAPIGHSTIHLLVISHSDADHLGEAEELLEEFRVERVMHTCLPSFTATWLSMMGARGEEVATSSASVRSLETHSIVPGEQIQLGEDVVPTLLAGWREWTDPGPTDAELRSVISIVLRLDYAVRSILYTGDTIGRRLNDPDNACKDAEAWMVAQHRSGVYSLAADVLLAPPRREQRELHVLRRGGGSGVGDLLGRACTRAPVGGGGGPVHRKRAGRQTDRPDRPRRRRGRIRVGRGKRARVQRSAGG